MDHLKNFEDVHQYLVFNLPFAEDRIDGLAGDIVSISTQIVEKFKKKRNVELDCKLLCIKIIYILIVYYQRVLGPFLGY